MGKPVNFADGTLMIKAQTFAKHLPGGIKRSWAR